MQKLLGNLHHYIAYHYRPQLRRESQCFPSMLAGWKHHNSRAGSSAGGHHCSFTRSKGHERIYTGCGRSKSGIMSPGIQSHSLYEIVLRAMKLKSSSFNVWVL